ncbi:MAG: septal ring lytic transglycosylase RlpA family protein [Actinomycetota bacterium]|nr:septal ring lytic transglycosylase RlpA family protein [Actinomycetota bacterium]MDQ3575639.1 septal ring lytic transglycosylase RlpA family protein [Actinomycetota bacterium]
MTRALAALVALTTMVGLAQVAPATAARAADDPRTSRAHLLLRTADLTDRLEATQVEVVAAQMGQARARSALTHMRDRMRTRAVRAYVQGPEPLALTVKAPHAYLEVAAAKERQLMKGYRAASATAGAEQKRVELARDGLRRSSAELAQAQSQLEAVIAAQDQRGAEDRQRRDEEQRREDEARMAALARRTSLWAGPDSTSPAAGTSSAAAGGSSSSGGYAPSPLDPGALLPRHKRATERQLALMSRIPFGPLAPGASLPAGLRRTGQRVVGIASWYGPGFNGRPTASGAIYDQEGWTVASKDLPLGTLLVVSRGDRRVLLLVNDRGPYVGDRVLDLSAAGARAVGLGGVGPVVAEVVAGT